MKLALFTEEEINQMIEQSAMKAFDIMMKKAESRKSENKFITIEETAALLKVSKQTIRNYITKGALNSKKIGRRLLVNRESIENNLQTVKSLKYKR